MATGGDIGYRWVIQIPFGVRLWVGHIDTFWDPQGYVYDPPVAMHSHPPLKASCRHWWVSVIPTHIHSTVHGHLWTPWAVVGRALMGRAPYGPGPHGRLWALVGRALGPLWAPWALMGRAPMDPLGSYGPGPYAPGPYGLGPHGPPWALLGRDLMDLPGPFWAGHLWAGPSWAPSPFFLFHFSPGLLVQTN